MILVALSLVLALVVLLAVATGCGGAPDGDVESTSGQLRDDVATTSADVVVGDADRETRIAEPDSGTADTAPEVDASTVGDVSVDTTPSQGDDTVVDTSETTDGGAPSTDVVFCDEAGCDDQNPCTLDTCDPVSGLCLTQAIPGAPCDDLDLCTTGDFCDATGHCAGIAIDCDDDNSCTNDSCLGTAGGCQHLPMAGAPCDDAEPCTLHDRCDSGGACSGALDSCADDNPCSDDGCVLGVGCQSLNNGLCDAALPWLEQFDCAATQGWAVETIVGTPSPWAVDDGDAWSPSCSLNVAHVSELPGVNVTASTIATSPRITTAGTSTLWLAFAERLQRSLWSDSPNASPEIAQLQLSTDEFVTYEVLDILRPGPGDVWRFRTVDLSAWAGMAIRLRFYADTWFPDIPDKRLVWYVDDLSLSTEEPSPPPGF